MKSRIIDMTILTGISILLAIGIVIGVAAISHGKDAGEWSTAPAERKQWFQDLVRPDHRPERWGCCDQSDCRPVESKLDAGHWWAKIEDKWEQVPDEKVEKDPHTLRSNPTGSAVACYTHYNRNPLTWYCFIPWETLI